MIDFRPTESPLGIPVVATFQVRDRVYVVDADGMLYQIMTGNDNPEYWSWTVVQYL